MRGFTLIELMVVISLIALIASLLFTAIASVRAKVRDVQRVTTLKALQNALELYYHDHKAYVPLNPDGGSGFWGFTYKWRNTDGSCGGTIPNWAGIIRFDNSASVGFIETLADEGYISESVKTWNDPLQLGLGSIFNCRYIILGSEDDIDDVQRYFLHCNMEVSNALSKNDNGTHDTLYELGEPYHWLCVNY